MAVNQWAKRFAPESSGLADEAEAEISGFAVNIQN
jgi:hypothetical protein